jgi:hypothetical protein
VRTDICSNSLVFCIIYSTCIPTYVLLKAPGKGGRRILCERILVLINLYVRFVLVDSTLHNNVPPSVISEESLEHHGQFHVKRFEKRKKISENFS